MDTRYFACDTDLDVSGWIAAIERELDQVNIHLCLTAGEQKAVTISVPDTNLSCRLEIGGVDPGFTTGLVGYDFPVEAGRESLRKKYLLTLTGDREDRAVNFIFNLITKVLGSITHGTMIDVEQAYVTDDWITWGYDYLDGDMFEAFNSVGLDQEYPALRKT